MILAGHDVDVIVERKKIKNIYFRINEEGNIHITCPKLVSAKEISRLLEENRSSLEKMYKRQQARCDTQKEVYILGKKYNYVYYKNVMFEQNYAFGPSIEDINKYLYKHALEVFAKRLELYVNEFDNLPKFRLRTRIMKSRWGVCNIKSMTVTLNSLLIHKKPFLIDYVICHELSHFAHMDHSAAFWQEVGNHFPEYKKARKELKE